RLLVAREARVAAEIRAAERARQLLPEPVIGGGDEDPLPVAAHEVPIWRQRRMAGAQCPRYRAREQVPLGVEREQAHCGLEKGSIHPLAEPGAPALKKSV